MAQAAAAGGLFIVGGLPNVFGGTPLKSIAPQLGQSTSYIPPPGEVSTTKPGKGKTTVNKPDTIGLGQYGLLLPSALIGSLSMLSIMGFVLLFILTRD